jgi:Rieske Fe-S protein
LIVACGQGSVTDVPRGESELADGVSVRANDVFVQLDRVDALRAPDSAFIVGALQLAILRVGDADYRAFSNVCTHAGCGIYAFVGQRLRCPCHGSEFDVDGVNVAGPAMLPLPRFAVSHNRELGELRISRG